MKLYLFYRFTWNYKNRVWKNEVKDIFAANSIAHVNVGKLLVNQLLVLLVTNQVNNKKAERAEMEKKATGHRWCKETKKQTFTLLTFFLKQVLVILTVKDGHCYTKRHVFVVLISSC